MNSNPPMWAIQAIALAVGILIAIGIILVSRMKEKW